MNKQVVQISIDILTDGKPVNLTAIEKALEEAGYAALGISFSANLTGLYKSIYPELLED